MLVREGEFVMGDDTLPDAAPAHSVTLPAYYIDRLEVTNRGYLEYCAHTGHPTPAPPSWEAGYAQQEDYPVVNVSRDDAAGFCRFAGKRLPSEEEWEKAARGSGEPVLLWGNWTLAGLAKQAPSWFPKGSGPEAGVKTAAKAEIWTDAAGFAAAASKLADETAKLQQVAAGGDIEAMRAQARAVGGACNTCHDKYRTAPEPK